MIDLFAGRIQAAYDRLGHEWGWRFMATPARTLGPQTDLAVVALNPGGATYSPPVVSVEEGNAYRIERWDGSRDIQVQMVRMYKELATRWPRPVTADELMDSSLAAHFCPFRSPNWNSLASRSQSIEFSRELWRDVLTIVNPRVMICLGETGRQLAGVMESAGAVRTRPVETGPIGWGAYTYSMSDYTSAHGQTLIVQIPHLSRFKIFGRAASREAIDRFTTAAAQAADLTSLS